MCTSAITLAAWRYSCGSCAIVSLPLMDLRQEPKRFINLSHARLLTMFTRSLSQDATPIVYSLAIGASGYCFS